MPEYRELGVCNTLTTGNVAADSFFVLATPVGALDDLMPQPVFFDWLIDSTGILEQTGSGLDVADGSVTEAKLHPDVVAQLGGGGGSSRQGGFDNLGSKSSDFSIDFTSGSFDNKRFSITSGVSITAVTVADPGAYELMIEGQGNDLDWTGFGLDAPPNLSLSGWTVVRLYYTPDNTWTW